MLRVLLSQRVGLMLVMLLFISGLAVQVSAFRPPLGNLTAENRKNNQQKEVLLDFAEINLNDDRKIKSLRDLENLDFSIAQKKSISRLAQDSIGALEGNHLAPNLSPNGKYLSFTVQTSRETKMFLYSFEKRKLSQIKAAESQFTEGIRNRRSFLRRRTRRTLAKGEIASNLAWSTDSRYYAFTSGGKVYLGMPNATGFYLLVDDQAYVAFPNWSPDNGQLVYTSGKTGKGDLYRIHNLKNFLDQILTDRSLQPESVPLAILKEPEQLTGHNSREKSGEEDFAIWQGESFSYHAYRGGTKGFDIFQFNPTINKPPIALSDFLDDQMYPHLSPDGQKIAFYSNRWQKQQGSPNKQLDKFAIFIADLSSNVPGSTLIQNQFSDNSVIHDTYKGPLWSPDSKYLIYIADRSEQKYPIIARRYPKPESLVDVRLTSRNEPNCTFVDLAIKNGKLLAFTAQKRAAQKLFVSLTNFPRSTSK